MTSKCVYFGSVQDPNGDFYSPAMDNFMSYSLKWPRDLFPSEQNSRAMATPLSLRPELVHASRPAAADCNSNGVRDICDIARGTSADVDADGLPDECAVSSGGPGDPDMDGVVDLADSLTFAGNFGPQPLRLAAPDRENRASQLVPLARYR